ncbi:MAG: internalin A [Phenylobacterium sp.]|jgi:internalin A
MQMTDPEQPSRDPLLRKYLFDVIGWHGYVKFLGMASLQRTPDVPMDHLYVGQSVSKHYLTPQTDEPLREQLQNPVTELLEHRRMVILGDPGCGKSTLINYFAWYASSGFVETLPGDLAYLLPVPIVLRDLALADVESFDDLIQAFLKRPVAEKLNDVPEMLQDYLDTGKVLILIDGLDEISASLRKKLSKILLAGFKQYDQCYVVCTSRIVGYEDAPLSGESKIAAQLNVDNLEDLPQILPSAHDPYAPVVRYMAPFTDRQIHDFALKWYGEHGSKTGAGLLRKLFFKAVFTNDSTSRLARTPNLLTMMALIFKVRSQLPDGRALLYNDIAQAYLESIDTARGLKDPTPWQKKKFWLAKISFEMQLRREALAEDGDSQELLISREDILNWIEQAMDDSGDVHNEGYAEKYLTWVIRRSGLLVPRGEDLFAFMHLSFQEYFAAVYIQLQVLNPEWWDKDEDDDEAATLDPRVNQTVMSQWANAQVWQQSLVFLFELFDGQAGWTKRLWKYCFLAESFEEQKKSWEKEETDGLRLEFRLQVQLLSNPHSGVTGKVFDGAKGKLIDLAMVEQSKKGGFWAKTLLVDLLSSPQLEVATLVVFDHHQHLIKLNLNGLKGEVFERVWQRVVGFSDLWFVGLNESAVMDISPLVGLQHLQIIWAFGTTVTDFSPLQVLPDLQQLIVSKDKNITLDGIDPKIIHRLR